MSKVQSFLQYGSNPVTVASYTNWAEGIGSALSTIGWTKTSDSGNVTWANITSTAYIPNTENSFTGSTGTLTFFGAWSGGTSYTGVSVNNATYSASATATFSVVTNSGVTWQATLNTQFAVIGVLANTTNTGTVSSIPAGSSGSTTVTLNTGTAVTSNQFAGMMIQISGSASANNGFFLCASNTSGSTSFTAVLYTYTQTLGGGTALTTVSSSTGNWATSSSYTSYYNNTINVGQIGTGGGNNWYGLSVVAASFASGGNNGTFTVQVSGNEVTTYVSVIVVNNGSGVTGVQAGTLTINTAPTSDTYHWIAYNYEIWESNGSLSSTSPIYLKFVYSLGTPAQDYPPVLIANVGSAYVANSGAVSGNNTTEIAISQASGVTAQVGNIYECDFSGDADNFAMIMWRNATSGNSNIPTVLFIDRTRDQYGNGLSTFFNVGWTWGGNSNANSRMWTLFRSGIGGVIGPFQCWPTPFTSSTTGLSYTGMTPVLPIFPLPGYVANPVLEAIVMKTGDFTDGELINAVIYGTSHTYLMSKGPGVDTASFGVTFPGIRWE
jgi:hypothetical protein